MGLHIFLDDIRIPPKRDDSETWTVCRSLAEAVSVVVLRGSPSSVSFDHDLGDGNGSGFEFAKFLVDRDLDSEGAFLPVDFSFKVHSANPVGAANISGLLVPYLSFREKS